MIAQSNDWQERDENRAVVVHGSGYDDRVPKKRKKVYESQLMAKKGRL